MTSKTYNTIDLFAGCGGLMDGFMQEGAYNTLACVEWEEYPCKTLAKRLKDRWGHKNAYQEVVRFDIQRTEELINGFDDPEYGKNAGLDKLVNGKTVDIVIGVLQKGHITKWPQQRSQCQKRTKALAVTYY